LEYLKDLIHQIRHQPDQTAFLIRGESYSFGYLGQQVVQFQTHLLSLHRSGLPIAIACEDDIKCYALLLACLYSGSPFVPVHPKHPAERNQHILELSGAGQILKASDLEVPDGDNQIPQILERNEIAYILFTSGSTGIPKGVPVSHQALQAFIHACDASGLDDLKGKSCLQSFDLTFDLSLFGYLYPLVHGATVCTVPEDEMKQLAIVRILEEASVHTALLVPSVIQLLQPYFDRIELPDLRRLLFCGEALPAEILKQFMASVPNAEIRNVYGPTEATIFCMQYILPAQTKEWIDYHGVVTIGTPMSGMKVKTDSEGQLLLSGKQLASGYLTRDESQLKAFLTNETETWYQTGDLVLLHESGNYLFAGRKDQQVKIQGYRVETGEVEFQINKIVSPAQAIVVARNAPGKGQELIAFLNSTVIHPDEIQEALKMVLPVYMIPSRWVILDSFPLNVNGKIDRKHLATLNPVG
jgi:D-alanine--poly(phosphoribitol) ligase subunit 1